MAPLPGADVHPPGPLQVVEAGRGGRARQVDLGAGERRPADRLDQLAGPLAQDAEEADDLPVQVVVDLARGPGACAAGPRRRPRTAPRSRRGAAGGPRSTARGGLCHRNIGAPPGSDALPDPRRRRRRPAPAPRPRGLSSESSAVIASSPSVFGPRPAGRRGRAAGACGPGRRRAAGSAPSSRRCGATGPRPGRRRGTAGRGAHDRLAAALRLSTGRSRAATYASSPAGRAKPVPSGYWCQTTPSSARPPAFGVGPPSCFRRNAVPASRHWSRSDRSHPAACGRSRHRISGLPGRPAPRAASDPLHQAPRRRPAALPAGDHPPEGRPGGRRRPHPAGRATARRSSGPSRGSALTKRTAAGTASSSGHRRARHRLVLHRGAHPEVVGDGGEPPLGQPGLEEAPHPVRPLGQQEVGVPRGGAAPRRGRGRSRRRAPPPRRGRSCCRRRSAEGRARTPAWRSARSSSTGGACRPGR